MSDRGGEPLRGGLGLYVMGADGSNQRPLVTDRRLQLGSLAWAPDGRALAFTGNTDAGWEIFSVQADGSGLGPLLPRPLPEGTLFSGSSTWSGR